MLSLALIAGCGRAERVADSSPPAGSPAAQGSAQASGEATAPVPKVGSNPEYDEINAQDVKIENMVADCMKKQGFTYIPHPTVYGGGAAESLPRYTMRASLLEPVDTVRAWRQKYGFGVYATLVYPNDPQIAEPEPAPNPNDAIVEGLDPARRKAYQLALSGREESGLKSGRPAASELKKMEQSCGGKASKAFGDNSGESTAQEKKDAADHRIYRKFQSDPAVVSAAQKYVTCLRSKGFRPTSTRPGSIETALADATPQPKEGLSRAAAEQGLAKEIKAALADLDCRTSYATIMRTKYPAVVNIFPGQG